MYYMVVLSGGIVIIFRSACNDISPVLKLPCGIDEPFIHMYMWMNGSSMPQGSFSTGEMSLQADLNIITIPPLSTTI